MTSRYDWPERFWSDFIKDYWEQHPCQFKLPIDLPFVNLDELFYAITHMPEYGGSDRLWILRNSPPKKYLDFTMGNLKLIGPQRADINFDGYFKRMQKHRTGVNLHAIDKGLPEIRSRVEHSIRMLTQEKSTPVAEKWVLDTFFGTYLVTPFGIHKDPASIISVVLKGERTYCTWPSDYFSQTDDAVQTPDEDKIKPHLKNAQIFNLKEGDVFYWPSNRWHVVLSDGSPSITAQLSAYFAPNDLDHWNHVQS